MAIVRWIIAAAVAVAATLWFVGVARAASGNLGM
jgi:hypothetical protein